MRSEVLRTSKEERNSSPPKKNSKKRKADWIGNNLRRNCLLRHVIERKIREKDISDGETRKKA